MFYKRNNSAYRARFSPATAAAASLAPEARRAIASNGTRRECVGEQNRRAVGVGGGHNNCCTSAVSKSAKAVGGAPEIAPSVRMSVRLITLNRPICMYGVAGEVFRGGASGPDLNGEVQGQRDRPTRSAPLPLTLSSKCGVRVCVWVCEGASVCVCEEH